MFISINLRSLLYKLNLKIFLMILICLEIRELLTF